MEMNKKQKCIEKLQRIQKDTDYEKAHSEADDALLAYINDKEIIEEYQKITRWCA